MNRLTVVLIASLLLLLWRAEANLTISVRHLNGIVAGQQEDLFNLQRQIDGTYVRGPLPVHVDESTPTPLTPRHLHKHVGQEIRSH